MVEIPSAKNVLNSVLASVPLTTAEMESMKGNSRLRFVEVLNIYEPDRDSKIVTFLNSSYLPF